MATGFAFTSPPDLASDARVQEIHRRHAALAAQSHHEILGVPPGGDRETVRAAYRSMARRFHPDAQAGASASLAAEVQAIFIRATEAYQALSSQGPAEASPPSRSRPSAPVSHRPPSPRRRPPAPTVEGSNDLREKAAPEMRLESPVEVVLHHAKELLLHGDAERAASLLHGVAPRATGADRDRIRRLLARACILEPRWRRYALSQLHSLLEGNPEDPEALALLGALYHREGLLTRAESTLRRALRADPAQPDARSALRQVRTDRERAGGTNIPPEARRRGLLSRFLAHAMQEAVHE